MDKMKMDETSTCTHALPHCAVWNHIGRKFYTFSFEIYNKDYYGNIDWDNLDGSRITMKELEKLGRDRLPDDSKDMELYDMYFEHSDKILFVTVCFVNKGIGI